MQRTIKQINKMLHFSRLDRLGISLVSDFHSYAIWLTYKKMHCDRKQIHDIQRDIKHTNSWPIKTKVYISNSFLGGLSFSGSVPGVRLSTFHFLSKCLSGTQGLHMDFFYSQNESYLHCTTTVIESTVLPFWIILLPSNIPISSMYQIT